MKPRYFLKKISKKCKYICLHIPLEDIFAVHQRDLFKNKIKKPGHLSYYNTASAINLLTECELEIIDYLFTPGFNAPSGLKTFRQKIFWIPKYFLSKISTYLTSSIFGSISLMILCKTKK